MRPRPVSGVRRVLWRASSAAAVALTVGGLASGCGVSGDCAFAVSLARTTGGADSPVAAAETFAATGDGHGLPRDGWRLGDADDAGHFVRSGSAVVHTVRGSDSTWFVDSGECG